jgi:hypothetical protein
MGTVTSIVFAKSFTDNEEAIQARDPAKDDEYQAARGALLFCSLTLLCE